MPNIKPASILFSFVFLFSVLYPANFQASEAYPGYTLFSIDKTAYLYDMNGKNVHEWKVPEGSVQTSNTKLNRMEAGLMFGMQYLFNLIGLKNGFIFIAT
jgi:hypothetical protein